MTAGNGANVLFMYLHARVFQRAFVCFSLCITMLLFLPLYSNSPPRVSSRCLNRGATIKRWLPAVDHPSLALPSPSSVAESQTTPRNNFYFVLQFLELVVKTDVISKCIIKE